MTSNLFVPCPFLVRSLSVPCPFLVRSLSVPCQRKIFFISKIAPYYK
jgi:hypothetical protein